MFVHKDYWIVNPTNRESRIIGKAMSRLKYSSEDTHTDMSYLPMIIFGLAIAAAGTVAMLMELNIVVAAPLALATILLSLLALAYFCYRPLIHRKLAQARMNRLLQKLMHSGRAFHMKSADNESVDNLFDVLVISARDMMSSDTQLRHLFNLYTGVVNDFLGSDPYSRLQERINSGESTMVEDQVASLVVASRGVIDEIIQADQQYIARERAFDEGLVRDVSSE